MVQCYSELYEEGEVEHINGIWPSFLTYIRESELICSIAIYGIKSHVLLCSAKCNGSGQTSIEKPRAILTPQPFLTTRN